MIEDESKDPKWKRFEKLAYEIQREFAGSATVTLNDSIQGVDSKTSRQIDISVRQNIGQYPILVVIDCKDYKDPVDVKTVEEFAGDPGSYEALVGKNLAVTFQGVTSTVDVSATVLVGREFFLGPIPVSLRGLHDVQHGGIITRQLRTDMVDFHLVESGKLPGWTKIDDPSNLSVKVAFRLAYSDGYGEYPDDNTQPEGQRS